MTQQIIYPPLGDDSYTSGEKDTFRTLATKTQANFTELYNDSPVNGQMTLSNVEPRLIFNETDHHRLSRRQRGTCRLTH